jgi:predicted ATPase
VTFLFTDIEGSTRLLQKLGDRYAEVLNEHRRVLREAFQRHGGVEVDTQGDAFFYAFAKATDAVRASQEGQAALAGSEVLVRMGLHTGEPLLTDDGYVGVDVHRAARICSAAHGGQTLLSETTARLIDADLRDLGEHRLKDLERPLRLYQVGSRNFAPVRTLNASNLPVPASTLVGRERECRELSDVLREHRLVTVVGPGGSGKTRLALEVAAAMIDEFKDGVFWVPLAAVSEPDLVEATIARTVDVTDGLATYLARRQVLLLLDNFEQLIGAAPGLGELLAASPGLKFLITSREPLQLSGEWEYAVPPMQESDAILLFTERAKALKSDFTPDDAVTQVCRRLDGLPLALELAAARVKVLAPRQMLDRLGHRLDLLTAGARDLPIRQRTLRGTVDWSYDLLARDEQTLFVRVAVFSGGWTVDEAEAVCDANLDTLESLVAKSLVVRIGERFGMLETLREYGLERLDESPERVGMRDRHAMHFLALAEEGGREFERGEQATWTQRLNAEHDNLSAALQHFVHADHAELELRLVNAIWKFWFDQGLWQESSRAVGHALTSSSGTTPARVGVMHGAAWTSWRQGHVAEGLAFAEQSLQLSRALGNAPLIATSLRILGVCTMAEDPKRAASLFEESVALSESVGDVVALTAALNNLAILATQAGEHRRAAEGFGRALAIAQQSGNQRGSCGYQMNLAHAERELGDYEMSRVHFAQSLEGARKLGFREVATETLFGAAVLADLLGDHVWAGMLMGAAQREGDFGHTFDLDADRVAVDRTLASVEQHLGTDGLNRALAEGRELTLDVAAEYLERRPGDEVRR